VKFVILKMKLQTLRSGARFACNPAQLFVAPQRSIFSRPGAIKFQKVETT
jgi:hypothetical protein